MAIFYIDELTKICYIINVNKKETFMNKNIIPIPEHWREHRLLSFVYWFAHYVAVNLVAIKHYHKIFPLHDIEKPFKLLIGVPYSQVKKEHTLKSHHITGKTDDQVNWIEAICDWEASGYTKPHSLLNAAETCKKYHPDKWHIVEPLLKNGGLLK